MFNIYNNNQFNNNNQQVYQSSFNYDDLFKDLKSDSYLKSFSQKRQESLINTDNQIRNNYQTVFQSQQNQEIYFSNVYMNNNNNNSYFQNDESYNNLYQFQQFSPKNYLNVQANSYIPSFQNSSSNSPPKFSTPMLNYPSSSPQYNNFFQNTQNPINLNQNLNFNNSRNGEESFFPSSTQMNSFEDKQFPSLSGRKLKTKNGVEEKKGSNETEITTNTQFNQKVGEQEITIEVWEENLVDELKRISQLSEKYCVIGYDCEFPGVIYQPKNFDYRDNSVSYPYLKSNVDHLQVIQIGFTLTDEKGNLPLLFPSSNSPKIISWQFNFKFDLKKQPHNTKSIQLLKESGIDFQLLAKKGIDSFQFGKLLLESGLVMNERIKWITFHSMFDYGYLIKMLTFQPLPVNESQFFNFFHTFFPTSFDIKYFFHHHTSIKIGGLESISKSFNLERKGTAHQAGSDSFLTVKLFFSILKTYRNQWIDHNFQNNLNGTIFGLNYNPTTKVY